jgi:hypothetical protein
MAEQNRVERAKDVLPLWMTAVVSARSNGVIARAFEPFGNRIRFSEGVDARDQSARGQAWG